MSPAHTASTASPADTAIPEQRTHGLSGHRGGDANQGEESHSDRSYGHSGGGSDPFVHAGEQQWPGHQDDPHAHRDPDRRGGPGRAGRQAQDGAEQHVHPGRPVRPAVARGIDGQEQDSQSQHPREHAADHHVVGPAGAPEDAHPHRDGHRGAEQAEPEVEPGGEGSEGAGEGDVAERIPGEHLAPEHHEVPDQSARGGDTGPGQKGVAHERVRQDGADQPGHRADRGHGRIPATANGRTERDRSTIRRATRARTYAANEKVVMNAPVG